MAYSVDIIYSKNEDYTNPQTVTETGQPTSIQLTNLESDQAYYIKAVLKNDGVVEDEDTSKFTTLSASDKTKYFYIKNTSGASGVFTITKRGTPITTADLKYSFDSVNWKTADLSNGFSLDVAAGETVYMKGINRSGFNRDYNGYYKMSMDVVHIIGGNIMSIVDEEDYTSETFVPDYCFFSLFRDDTYLVNAADVNFAIVKSIWYWGCRNMFYGCTSLTTPPDLSSVTSIDEEGCRSMFYGCTSLTTPPDLSSVTNVGDYGCYNMFYGCTKLTKGLDLRKVTMGESGSFDNMYEGCTSLKEAIAPNISEWDTGMFYKWLNNVAPTGVVYKPAKLTIPTDSTSGIPSGWTTQNY